MEESIKINVKLSLQDAKDVHYSQLYKEYPEKKPNIFLNIRFGIITFLNILIISSYLVFAFGKPFLSDRYQGFVNVMFLPYLLILLLINFTAGKRYFVWLSYFFIKSSYKKNKLSNIPTQYEISAHGLKIKSKVNDYTYEWDAIYEIKELPMHFIMFIHKTSACIIPKRFFVNQAQLDRFVAIIAKNVASSKLKLKGYKIDESHFNQEVIDILDEEGRSKEANNGHEEFLEYFSFGVDKSIRVKVSLAMYFQLRSGRVFTFIGILIFALWISNVMSFSTSSLYGIIILTMFCGVFTFYMPFMALRGIVNSLTKIDQGRGYCVGYNEDKLVIDIAEGSMQLEWNQLYRVKEYKSFFLFNISSGKAFPIPKSIFDSEPEKLKQLQEIISNKCK